MGLSIKGLSKSFGEKIIFNNFSYDFPEKGIIRITGPSGIGKTTLLRIISRLDKDFGGSIEGSYSVSYAFQEHRLLPLVSALDNVVIASFDVRDATSRKSAADTLIRLGFTEADLSLKPASLSGGMKQRVSLARAFLRKSDILILDEPTKELDKSLSLAVLELIREAAKNKLVIVVTHDSVFDSLDVEGIIAVGS